MDLTKRARKMLKLNAYAQAYSATEGTLYALQEQTMFDDIEMVKATVGGVEYIRTADETAKMFTDRVIRSVMDIDVPFETFSGSVPGNDTVQ